MKIKMFFALVALALLAALFPAGALADVDSHELQLIFSYSEVDATGNQIRDMYDLIQDGVFENVSKGRYADYEIRMDFSMSFPGSKRHDLQLYAFADYGDRTVDYPITYESDPQAGRYLLVICIVPDGYKWINDVVFELTQEEVNTVLSGGVVQKHLNIVIAKEGVAAPAPSATTAPALIARPTASAVLVNGQRVAFDAYNIAGNNYFKLRDLAFALNGSSKQFQVGYDSANSAITLGSGQAYSAVGGEMATKGTGSKNVIPTSSKIYLDGQEKAFTAYNIDGNNYFKLRDIGQAFNFGVDWNGASNTIALDTGKGYTPEAPAPAPAPATPLSGSGPTSSTDGMATFSRLRETEYALEDYEWSCGFAANVRFGPVAERPLSLRTGFTYWGADGKRSNTFTTVQEGMRDDPPYYEMGFHSNMYQVIRNDMPPETNLVDGQTYHWVAFAEYGGKRYESAERTFVFKLPATLPSMQSKPADPTIRFENMNEVWRPHETWVGFVGGYIFNLEYQFYGGWNYSEVGIQCWDSSGKEINYKGYSVFATNKNRWTGSDSSGLENPFFLSLAEYFPKTGELDSALTPGQTYTWSAYVISDGVRYESPKKTFVFSTDAATRAYNSR